MKGTSKHYRVAEKNAQQQLKGQFITKEDSQKQTMFFGLGVLIALLNGIIIGSLAGKRK